MGVKLQKLIVRVPIELVRLQKRFIAIDAPNIIYSLFSYTLPHERYYNSEYITDRTGRVISHLYGLLYRVNFFYKHKIFPIFCFDGRESELKRIITKDYLHDFHFIKKRYEDARRSGNIQTAKNIAFLKEYFWPNIIDESKRLLNALGIPYLNAPASAEAQCAQLVKNNSVYHANSQDFDILLYGCPYTVQNVFKSLKRKVKDKWIYKKINPLLVNLQENLKRLQINQFQLVDLAILIGTDYFSGIKHIGPMNALRLIKKYQNLDNIISYEKDKYDFRSLTPDLIKKIRKIFLMPDVIEHIPELHWYPPEKSEIIRFLCEDHTLNRKRVEKNAEQLIKNYLDCKKLFLTKHSEHSVQKTLDMVLK
jgi:flap endonuclease-1